MGATSSKQPKAEEGDTLAFGRLEHIRTGDAIRDAKQQGDIPAIPTLPAPEPVHAFALVAKDRKDEVRLTAAVAKLCEEDPSLVFAQDAASGEMRLAGQGEMHLRVALERLADRFGVLVNARRPGVAYRETIRDGVTMRGRQRSNRAVTGSSAMSCSTFGRASAAMDSPSRKRSTAARCRSSISRPWKPAAAMA